MKAKPFFVHLFIMAILACPLRGLLAQDNPTPGGPTDQAALQFVRSFYGWYAPAQTKSDGRGVDLVLKRRPALLSEPLKHALQEDSRIQARAKGEIDGLDFDPFLNSQDPAKSYVARRVAREGSQVVVQVYASDHPAASTAPDVEVLLETRGAGWLISNLRYPGHGDLLSLLRLLHHPPKHA